MRRRISRKVLGGAVALAGAVLAVPAAANEDLRIGLVTGGCVGCHGSAGSGGHGIPKIAGTLSRGDFVAKMKAFRDDQSNPTVMNRIARGYSDEEFALMALRWAKAE